MTHSYKRRLLQNAAVATGVGLSLNPLDVADGPFNLLTAQVTGITSATITWQVTIDGTNWVNVMAKNVTDNNSAVTTTANGIFMINVAGTRGVRANITVYATGTIYVHGVLTAVGI